jgi:UDP-glucuronate 4-epimerase
MTDSDGRLLVTGAMGCIGAWVVKQALDQGLTVLAVDASTEDHRLTLALGDDTNTDRLVRATADVTDSDSLVGLIEEHAINSIVHLAALQVPAVAAQPILGARVNVVGMAVVLDAMVRCGITTPLAYASSIAAYEEGDQGGETSGEPSGWPSTLYGVYKRANEGAAHVYSERDGISSIGLRPYVVYGPGRDFGMTSDPTFAMKAVVDGEPFHVRFGGVSQMQYVEDVAAAFLAVTRSDYQGATVVNVGGPGVGMEDVMQAMEAVAPATRDLITYDDVQLPFPPVVESHLMEVLPVPEQTSIAEGVARTIDRFRWAAQQTQ